MRKRRFLEEKAKKNQEIIEGVNKRYGGFGSVIRHDQSLGKYRPMERIEQKESKVGFFMTNVDVEKKKPKYWNFLKFFL